MTDANLDVVREMYAAMSRVDLNRLRELAVPDFEWETDARLPNAGVYRGEERVLRFFEDQSAPFESTEMEIERLFPKGDQVVAFVTARSRLRDSTAEIEIHVGHLWTLRDRRIVRGQAFAKREEALEAAGIPARPD